MPFSVFRSSGAALGGPRNQPAKPGLPAPDAEVTSLTSTWKLAQWRRRVAPQAVPAGRGVFFSGWPSASMNSRMVLAELLPNLMAPTPSAARTILSFVRTAVVVVGAVDVVVGAAVVVVADSLSPSPPQATPARSTTGATMRAARCRQSWVMNAQSTEWAQGTGGHHRYPASEWSVFSLPNGSPPSTLPPRRRPSREGFG